MAVKLANNGKWVFLYGPKLDPIFKRHMVRGKLVWDEETQRAFLNYHNKQYRAVNVRFHLDVWPPTEADIKRADVMLAMYKGVSHA